MASGLGRRRDFISEVASRRDFASGVRRRIGFTRVLGHNIDLTSRLGRKRYFTGGVGRKTDFSSECCNFRLNYIFVMFPFIIKSIVNCLFTIVFRFWLHS